MNEKLQKMIDDFTEKQREKFQAQLESIQAGIESVEKSSETSEPDLSNLSEIELGAMVRNGEISMDEHNAEFARRKQSGIESRFEKHVLALNAGAAARVDYFQKSTLADLEKKRDNMAREIVSKMSGNATIAKKVDADIVAKNESDNELFEQLVALLGSEVAATEYLLKSATAPAQTPRERAQQELRWLARHDSDFAKSLSYFEKSQQQLNTISAAI